MACCFDRAIAVIPAAFIVTFWIARAFACPECSGPTYDVGILGAIIYNFIGLTPMMVGAALGILAGRMLVKWLKRPSADR